MHRNHCQQPSHELWSHGICQQDMQMKHFQLFVHMRYGHIEHANKACTAGTVNHMLTWRVATRHDSSSMCSQTLMGIRHPGLKAQVHIISKLAVCRCCTTGLTSGMSLAFGDTSGSRPTQTLRLTTCRCHHNDKCTTVMHPSQRFCSLKKASLS